MISDVLNKGHIWNIESVMILGNVDEETNWMQVLHMGAIDPIQEHHLQKFFEYSPW